MSHWVPYDASYLVHDFCLEKAKELRASGEFLKVRVGSTIVEEGRKYSKIYLLCKE